ncbi:hypothetical protein [Bradyrhizobium sp. S69]|jgi:hypothetical protein|uniref:hypothetical protein n=1 Tax=Bradyrhizobium sp. S69 TaxID=1641856 RepID=UPI00131BCB99|nr:hypothetical protein [Bradyrhizobium sp. S69]
MSNLIGEVAAAELPPEDVAQKLRDFLQTLKSFGAESNQMVDASSALTALVDDLEQKALPITMPGSTPSKRWSCERPKLVFVYSEIIAKVPAVGQRRQRPYGKCFS